MHRSTDRILTTHVGSLIRPDSVRRFLRAKQKGEGYDAAAHAQCLRQEVAAVVRQQAEVGVDVVSDGEFGKGISWSQYVIERVSGFERRPFNPSTGNPFTRGADRERFAEFYKELDAKDHVETVTDTVAVAPIKYTGQALLQQDIDNFKAALRNVKVVEGFLPVAAPASVIPDRKNEYYKSEDDLADAIGQAMHVEYKQIVDNGLLVQLDDARAAVTYDRMVPPASFQDYRKRVRLYQDVLNRATQGIPTEKIRYHVCWGSWPGPHTTDVPIKDIIDLILRVRAGAYVLEMANPRHEHEWRVWETAKLPKGSVLIPGVISHATNVVEHPELVAERIVRLAKLVGRENVIAGTDCGFAQQPFYQRVHPSIQWAKLQALVEGARIASKERGRGRRRLRRSVCRKRRKCRQVGRWKPRGVRA
jgi:5-methyltetrahydropteroyltriglutamate--homocysteine methyltransferase